MREKGIRNFRAKVSWEREKFKNKLIKKHKNLKLAVIKREMKRDWIKFIFI